MYYVDKDLQSIQEARILIDLAFDAQVELQEFLQTDIDEGISKIYQLVSDRLPNLLVKEMACTQKGDLQDKIRFSEEFLKEFYQGIMAEKVIGILEKNADRPVKIGVPVGVVAISLPSENVFLQAIYSIILAIKAGNSVILIPEAGTESLVGELVTFLQAETKEAGLPYGCINWMKNTTFQGQQEIFNHPKLALGIVIGKAENFDNLRTTKPTIYGSVGLTPVFVEQTANLQQAAENIIESRSFDNGLLPASEQFVIAEGKIADEFANELTQGGGYFLSAEDEKKLGELLFAPLNKINPLCIGKSACWLAKQAGFQVPTTTKVLISKQAYIFDENPFTNLLQCPVITFYLEPDWRHACEKCMTLLADKENGHTLAIHSQDTAIIQEFALRKPVGRMIVNQGCGFASLGMDSSLPLTLILGGLTSHRGIIAKNVTAKDLTYQREIGYSQGVKDESVTLFKGTSKEEQIGEAALEKILLKILEQK